MKFILRLLADLSFFFTVITMIALPVGVFEPRAFDTAVLFYIWLIPSGVYTIYAIITYRKFTHGIEYSVVFSVFFKIFGLFSLLALIFGGWEFYFSTTLPVSLIFFACSTSFMKISRHTEKVQQKAAFKFVSIAPMLAIMGLVFLFAITWATGVFGTAMSVFYTNIIAPIILAPIRFFFWVFRLGSPFENISIEIPPEVVEEGYGLLGLDEMNSEPNLTGIPLPMLMVAIFLGGGTVLAVVLAIAMYFAGVFKTLTGKTAIEKGIEDEYIPLDEDVKLVKDKVRNPMRRLYHRFLRKCWKNGIAKRNGLTSAIYLELSSNKFGQDKELATFRDVYLPVRYSEHTQASKEDLALAKKLVARLGK